MPPLISPDAPRLIIGCGYLGRRVAVRWIAAGAPVFALTRGRTAELQSLGITPIVGDVLDPASLTTLPAAATVLYAVGFDRTAGKPMREVYVTGLANVLAALPAPQRFVAVSSTGVYGQSDGSDVDESAVTDPTEESGKVVLDAERLLMERLPSAVRLRFAGIYGPNRLLRQASLQAGEPVPGDPDKWLNLIHVEDGTAAVLAAEHPAVAGQVYNVADDCPVRRRDFYTRLAAVIGAAEPRFVPPPLPETVNRRIVNRRMREELHVALRFPSFEEGLPAAWAATREGTAR